MQKKSCISAVLGVITACALFQGIGFFSCAGDNYRNVDTEQKVYDYANLLSESIEKRMRSRCVRMVQEYGYDIFVVTINENNISYETEDRSLSFLEDFGDENGFGIGEEQNYVAFLIDMDERQYSLDVKGDTCFLIYSDEIQEEILDAVYPNMKSGNYSGAVSVFLDKVEKCGTTQVSEFVGTEEEYEEYLRQQQRSEQIVWTVISVFVSLGIGAIGGAIVMNVKKSKSKTVYIARDASGYLEKGSYRKTENSDVLIRHYQTVRTIQTSSGGSSGGGGSHHTTTHRSSGGSRHSGGSRRF